MTETKLLPVVGRFGVPSAVTSRGTLSRASLASPASVMEVGLSSLELETKAIRRFGKISQSRRRLLLWPSTGW